MKKLKDFTWNRFFSSLIFRVMSSLLILLIVCGIFSSFIGFRTFTESLTKEYNDAACRTADTAAALLDADSFEKYLKNGSDYRYDTTLDYLDMLLEKQHVTLIYAIVVDTSDYGSFKNVYNSVEEGSGYSRWYLGYERETTNDEYREKYRQIYEEGLKQATIVRVRNLNGKVPHTTAMVPAIGRDGKVKGIICVQRPMEELTVGLRSYLREIAVVTVFLVVIASIVAGIMLFIYFVRPLKKIVDETARFAKENTRSSRDDLKNVSSITELDILGNSIDKMEQETISYMDDLTRATAEKERISTEFELASSIQSHAMPNKFPVFPDHNNFEVYATMEPAKEIGGDFYDFFTIDDRNLVLVTADVSGKGIPAALFMMIAKTIIKNQAGFTKNPAEILARSNDQLCDGNIENMFVTVWLAIVDIETGLMTYASAGHEKPLIRHNGVWELRNDRAGVPLGTLPGMKYKNFTISLEPGDMIFEYTDGVTEAINGHKEMYGTDRLTASLNRTEGSIPNYILQSVKQDLDRFVGDAEQFDDITMMGFCYRRSENHISQDKPKKDYEIITDESSGEKILSVVKTYPAEIENIYPAQDMMVDLISILDPSEKINNVIRILIEEMLSNVDSYAYPSKTGYVTVEGRLEMKKSMLTIIISDMGLPFDPTKEDTKSSADNEYAGLGIFIVKTRADSMEYERRDNKNVLIIKKRISDE